MHMQKVVINVGGVEMPVMVRHEEGGFMECETVQAVNLPGDVTVHPGALLRVPTGSISASRKAWFSQPPPK